MESVCEHLDLDLHGPADAGDVAGRLGCQLPEELRVIESAVVDPSEPSISEALRAAHYRVTFHEEGWGEEELTRRVNAFLAAERAVVTRAAHSKARPGKRHPKIAERAGREIDLKEIVTHLAVEGPDSVAFSLRADPSGSAKPAEVLAAVFGDGVPPRGVKVLKEGVSFARTTRSGPRAQPRAPRYLDA